MSGGASPHSQWRMRSSTSAALSASTTSSSADSLPARSVGRAATATPPGGTTATRPTDLSSLNKWDDYTRAKEHMFQHTDTDQAPWAVVKSNDKKRGRIDSMRYVLDRLDYDDRTRTPWAPPTPASLARRRTSMTRTG
jgi:hypothetical protein